jgi:hypothetical protein
MKFSEKCYFLFSSLLSQGVWIVSSLALFPLLTPMDYGVVVLAGLAPGYLAGLGDLEALQAISGSVVSPCKSQHLVPL